MLKWRRTHNNFWWDFEHHWMGFFGAADRVNAFKRAMNNDRAEYLKSKNLIGSSVDALDISDKALEVAKKNNERNNKRLIQYSRRSFTERLFYSPCQVLCAKPL